MSTRLLVTKNAAPSIKQYSEKDESEERFGCRPGSNVQNNTGAGGPK